MLEAWQADANGDYQAAFDLKAPFNSFGRTATTAEGNSEWRFVTVKPGAIARPDGRTIAPHINLTIFARGVNLHLQTRLYFDDEQKANAGCPVLGAIESPARRQTLIARCEEGGEGGLPHYPSGCRAAG